MSDHLVSVDEFLNARKDFVKDGSILMKAGRRAASSWDAEKRSVRFVMSAEVEDRDRDIIRQDGIKIDAFMENPAAFFNHKSFGRPVGSWSDVQKVSGRPKRTEGLLTLAPKGINEEADALALDIGAGLIRACSIGFIPKAIKKRPIPEDKKDGDFYWPGYDILEAELVECSPVTIPSNPAALAKMAETGDRKLASELIEQILDGWVKTEQGMIVPREEFERAHKQATGHKTSVTVQVPNEDEAEADPAAAADETAEQHGADDETVKDFDAAIEQAITETTKEAGEQTSKSLIGKLLDRIFGDENGAKLLQEIQQKRMAEAQAIVEEAATREAREKRQRQLSVKLALLDVEGDLGSADAS